MARQSLVTNKFWFGSTCNIHGSDSHLGFYEQIMPIIMCAISIVTDDSEELFIVLWDNYFAMRKEEKGVKTMIYVVRH